MKNENKFLFFLTIIFLSLVFFVSFKTNSFLNKTSEHIVLNFHSDNIFFPNLNYRKFNKDSFNLYSFYAEVKESEFEMINNSESYNLIIYRLAGNSYSVYFNGLKIGSAGCKESSKSNIWNSFSSFEIDQSLIKNSNEVRIDIYALYDIGLSNFPILISNPKIFLALRDWFDGTLKTLTNVSISFLILVSFFMIFFYITAYKNVKREILFFSLACFFIAINILDYMVFYHIPFDIIIFKKIVVSCMYLSAFFMGLAIYEKYKYKLSYYLAFLSVFSIVAINFIATDNSFYRTLYGYFNLTLMLNILSWLIISFKHKKYSFESKIIVLCSLVLLLFSGYDTINIILGNFSSISYTLFGLMFFSMGLILVVIEEYFELQKKIAYEEEKAKFMYEKAIKDGMTDIFNHEYVMSFLQNLKGNYSIVMLDIDDFKNINDNYGHQFGDDVIRFVAYTSKKFGDEDTITGRYGGDEFIYILLHKSCKQAILFSEMIKSAIQEKTLTFNKEKIKISLSIGIYYVETGEKDYKTALKRADEALYTAKNNGKNRIEIYTKLN